MIKKLAEATQLGTQRTDTSTLRQVDSLVPTENHSLAILIKAKHQLQKNKKHPRGENGNTCFSNRQKSYNSSSNISHSSSHASIKPNLSSIVPAPKLAPAPRQPLRDIRQTSNIKRGSHNELIHCQSNPNSNGQAVKFLKPNKSALILTANKQLQKNTRKDDAKSQSRLKISSNLNNELTIKPKAEALMFTTSDSTTPKSSSLFGGMSSMQSQIVSNYNSSLTNNSNIIRSKQAKNFTFRQACTDNMSSQNNITYDQSASTTFQNTQNTTGLSYISRPPRSSNQFIRAIQHHYNKNSQRLSTNSSQVNLSKSSSSHTLNSKQIPQHQQVTQYQKPTLAKDFQPYSKLTDISQEHVSSECQPLRTQPFPFKSRKGKRNSSRLFQAKDSDISSHNITHQLLLEENFYACRCLCEPRLVTQPVKIAGTANLMAEELMGNEKFQKESKCTIF